MLNIMKTKSRVPKIHKCCKCKKAFSLHSTLIKHLQRHTNDSKCTQCSKIFFSLVKLATHIKTHHTLSEGVKDILVLNVVKNSTIIPQSFQAD